MESNNMELKKEIYSGGKIDKEIKTEQSPGIIDFTKLFIKKLL
jgi:hypothetical protein